MPVQCPRSTIRGPVTVTETTGDSNNTINWNALLPLFNHQVPLAKLLERERGCHCNCNCNGEVYSCSWERESGRQGWGALCWPCLQKCTGKGWLPPSAAWHDHLLAGLQVLFHSNPNLKLVALWSVLVLLDVKKWNLSWWKVMKNQFC